MAEGIEEADSNSGSSAGDATTMLSAAMPCEVRDFGAYHNQVIKRSVSIATHAKLTASVNQGERNECKSANGRHNSAICRHKMLVHN